MYAVYRHTAPSGKAYIGATGQNPEHRWNDGKGHRHDRRLRDAIRKYGRGNIEHGVIGTGLDREQAYATEAEPIAKYDTANPAKGHDIGTGGECGSSGVHHSAESRRKISEAHRGHTVSPETRRKISKAPRGADNPNFGKHHSAETRRKMSEAKCKKAVCVETGEVYPSLSEASEAAGVSSNAISNALCGESKTSGGYHWTYAE